MEEPSGTTTCMLLRQTCRPRSVREMGEHVGGIKGGWGGLARAGKRGGGGGVPWNVGSVGEGGGTLRGGLRIFGNGRDIQWVHGLGPCTTPFFGCPLQIPYEIPSF
jgi:hypothetical protein